MTDGENSFTIDQIEKVLKIATTPPAVNQIFYNPYVVKSTAPLMEYMAEKHIIPEAYSALNSITRKPGGPVDKPVEEIAERLGVKDEQVLLAWAKAKG
jgi:diketogulonate reductase-like aldo/keto reductase